MDVGACCQNCLTAHVSRRNVRKAPRHKKIIDAGTLRALCVQRSVPTENLVFDCRKLYLDEVDGKIMVKSFKPMIGNDERHKEN